MTEKRKQADSLVWNSESILVMRGEEKEDEKYFEIAKQELIDKCGAMLEIFFGSVPYHSAM